MGRVEKYTYNPKSIIADEKSMWLFQRALLDNIIYALNVHNML